MGKEMILVGTTCAPWKCNGKGELAWLDTAEGMIDDAKAAGHDLQFFATLECDARKLDPYGLLLQRLLNLGGNFWTFGLDDHTDIIESGNRLTRICTGRNLVQDYAQQRFECSHILFLDTDTRVPADSISKLLEVDWPVTGGNVGAYNMSGSVVLDERGRAAYPFRVEEHWNTAGFLLVRREVFKVLRWRWDLEGGNTDDPCYQADQQVWGFGQTRVRKDVQGEHIEPLVPVEERSDKEMRRVQR